jgi:hypothetical protein
MESADLELTGIGGWLILVAIRLTLAPIFFLRTLLTVQFPYLASGKHEVFLASHQANAFLFAFEMTTTSVLLVMVLALNFLFYRKRRGFPSLMVFYIAT